MHQDKMALTFTKRLLIVGLLSCSSFSLLAANSSVHNYSEMDVVKALEDNEVVLAKEVFSRLNKAQQNGLTGQVLTSRILFREEKTEQSYDLLEQLKDDHNDNDEVSYYFGRSAIVMAQKASIFSKLSYASDALEAWEHTLSLNPKHIKALEGLIGFHIGAPSIAGGDIEQALKYANTLITLEPEKGYANLARAYWHKDQNQLAEKAIADGLAIAPNSAQLYFTQGSAYSRQAKDDSKLWEKARFALNKAIENAESDEVKQHALYQLGKVAVSSGEQTQLGINALTQLLAMEGKQYQQWGKYRLAELYLNDKQLTKADEFIALVNYQDDDELEDRVKTLAKKIKKAVKSQHKTS